MLFYDRVLWALRTWLDSWSGIGHVAVGMARQGYDLQLTRYDEKSWRAAFYTTGIEHPPTSASAWEPTPWRDVQGAAREPPRRWMPTAVEPLFLACFVSVATVFRGFA